MPPDTFSHSMAYWPCIGLIGARTPCRMISAAKTSVTSGDCGMVFFKEKVSVEPIRSPRKAIVFTVIFMLMRVKRAFMPSSHLEFGLSNSSRVKADNAVPC